MPKYAQITVRVTPAFKREFDQLRKKTGLSANKLLLEAVERKGGRRIEKRYTRTEVARALGCHPVTIGRLIAANPDIPITGRGTRMVRLTEKNIEALAERMGR